jgi:hypothetical protein
LVEIHCHAGAIGPLDGEDGFAQSEHTLAQLLSRC